MTIYYITQEQLDEAQRRGETFLYRGASEPGDYTWNEADSRYEPANQPARQSDTGRHSIMGIGGLGIYAENEMPVIPSEAAMRRIERLEATDVICRRCGASKNFDGAMFTTGGGNICDDCF